MNIVKRMFSGKVSGYKQILSNEEGVMSDKEEVEEADIVQCGSMTKLEMSIHPHTSILEQLEKNCTRGVETITFSMSDWLQVINIIKEVENKVEEMSHLTPVTQAHGLCRATVCQWVALSDKRQRADRNETKIVELYKMVEASLKIVDNLVQTEVIAIQGWWVEKSGSIRAKLEEMKHI